MSLYDLEIFKALSPDDYKELTEFFTVSKTRSRLSAMALDQAHEQNNKKLKDTRGGLAFLCQTEEDTLLKWSLYSPELVRLEEEYQSASKQHLLQPDIKKHHTDSPSHQSAYVADIKTLVTSIESVFNPFSSDSSSLRSLRDGLEICQSPGIEESIRSLKKLGDDQYREFVAERLLKPFGERKPLSDTIHNNAILLPRNCEVVAKKCIGMSEKEEKALLQDLQTIAPIRPDAVKAALR